MVRIAERSGAETDFVRVDLYDVGNRIDFGEPTRMPDAGKSSPDAAFDRWLASFWAQGRKRHHARR